MWTFPKPVDSLALTNLEDCISDLIDATRELHRRRDIEHDTQGLILRRAVRKMAVPIRKLIIDNDGQLLKKCVVHPMMHKLGEPCGPPRVAKIVFSTPKRDLIIGSADGSTQAVAVPPAQHTIVVGRLRGIERKRNQSKPNNVVVRITSPFDTNQETVGLDEWMNKRILQVNSVGYRPKDLLKLIGNYEGAHTNQFISMVAAGVKPEHIHKGPAMKYQLLNAVVFGQTTYSQIFVLATGLYLLDRLCELLRSDDYLNSVEKSPIAKEINTMPPGASGVIDWAGAIGCGYNELIVVGEQPKNPNTLLKIYSV